MSDETNPWTTLGSTRHHEDRYLAYDEDAVRHRSGREHTHVVFRCKPLSLAMLPVDPRGRTRLVGQWRYALDRYTWELPRGSGAAGGDPLMEARRELAEETGLRAGRWLEVLRLPTVPGISTDVVSCFAAWDTTDGEPQPEPEETLACRALPFAEAVTEALAGRVADAVSVMLILAVAERCRRGELPDDLCALLRRGGAV